MRRALSLGAAAVFATVLAGSAGSTSSDVWKKLRRPLRIPHIEPGSQCPVSRPDPKGDLSRIGFVATAWGTGPAYPLLGSENGRPVLRFHYPPPPESLDYGSQWSGQKVLWTLDPKRRGPVLIRGRQLDGPNDVRFDRGLVPPKELRIRGREWGSTPSRAGNRPSSTRLRAPGCYAYQIDGLRYSKLIVFEAKLWPALPKDVAAVVDALRARGISIELEDIGSNPAFRAATYSYRTKEGGIELFQFAAADDAEEATKHISRDGHTICYPGWCLHFDTIAPVHWHWSGRVVALYVGREAAMLSALEEVLGSPFAGHG